MSTKSWCGPRRKAKARQVLAYGAVREVTWGTDINESLLPSADTK
jgi:hypothetical protein